MLDIRLYSYYYYRIIPKWYTVPGTIDGLLVMT